MFAPEIPEAVTTAIAGVIAHISVDAARLRPEPAVHDFCVLPDEAVDNYGLDTAVLGAA
ncbi:MAG TPA: hypothetical protein VGH11_06725 [Jatrophihabitans sp.]|jgi:hypothetical protein